eukprot:3741747-Alexandrium_andersonii.AAC.1
MSASLVGSEMCIRDSCRRMRDLRGPDAEKSRIQELQSAIRQSAIRAIPVSYTHLTLPTICSV